MATSMKMKAGKKLGGMMAEALAERLVDEATDEALEGMGLEEFTSQPDKYNAYFEKILTKLNQIQGQLDQVETSLDNIESQLFLVGVSIDQVELQQLLAANARAGNVIHQNFQNYQAALVALSSGRTDKQKNGAALMRELFSTANLAIIEQRLSNVCTSFLGDAALIGLLAQMETILDSAQLIYADHSNRPGQMVIGRKVLDSFQPLDCAETYANAIENIIVPFFQSVVMKLTMGIILLETGYENTVQQENLDRHNRSIRLALAGIAGFWDRVTEKSRLEAKFEKLFRSHLTTLDDHLKHDYIWDEQDGMHPSPEDDGGIDVYHFDEKWTDWITVRFSSSDLDLAGAGIIPPVPDNYRGWYQFCLIPPDFQWGEQVEYLACSGGKYIDYLRGERSDVWWGFKAKYNVPRLSQMITTGDIPTALDDLARKLQQVLDPQKRLLIVEGNHQFVNQIKEGDGYDGKTAIFGALRVQAINEHGDPVPEVAVSFKLSPQSVLKFVQVDRDGHAVVTVKTDAQGIASLDNMAGGSAGRVYDDLGNFSIDATADSFGTVTFQGQVSASRLEIIGGDGQSLNLAPDETIEGSSAPISALQVKAINYGEPLDNLLVRFAVEQTADGLHVQLGPDLMQSATALTNEEGIATLSSFDDGFAGRVLGGAGDYTISVTAEEWPVITLAGTVTNRKMAIVEGDNQTAKRLPLDGVEGGIAQFAPLAVKLTDESGMPAAGVAVTFLPIASQIMAITMNRAADGVLTVQTDAAGIARLGNFSGSDPADGISIEAYYEAAKFSVSASAEGWPTVTFRAEVTDRTMTIEAGNNQAQKRHPLGHEFGSSALFTPLQVRLTDEKGNPVQDVSVQFEAAAKPNSMLVQFDAEGSDVITVTTDERGMATLSSLDLRGYSAQASAVSGDFSIATSADGWPSTAFNLAVLNDSLMSIVHGNNQRRPRYDFGDGQEEGSADFDPLQVKVTDAQENPLQDIPVIFSGLPNDRVSVDLDENGNDEVTVQTDAKGIATLSKFSDGSGLYAFDGTGKFTVQAEIEDGPQVIFNLEVTG